jgi:hypothetical protein
MTRHVQVGLKDELLASDAISAPRDLAWSQ